MRDLDDQVPVGFHLPAPPVVHESLDHDPRYDPEERHDLVRDSEMSMSNGLSGEKL